MVARVKLTSAPALNDKAFFLHLFFTFYFDCNGIFIRYFHRCANDRFISFESYNFIERYYVKVI